MTHHSPLLTRRQWLGRASTVATGLGLTTAAGLLATRARAAVGDYRALVCVSLFGGNDAANTIVPTDSARYSQYADARGALALAKSSLVPLPASKRAAAAETYGMHPALAPLLPLWNSQRMAVLFNTGPLARAVTQADVLAGVDLPPALFSHAEQQALWDTAGAELHQRTGWGGRASTDVASVFPVMGMLERSSRFGGEMLRAQLTLPAQPQPFEANDLVGETWEPRVLRRTALDSLVASRSSDLNALATEYASQHRGAFALVETPYASGLTISAVMAATPGSRTFAGQDAIDDAFAAQGLVSRSVVQTGLPAQLYQVAKTIAVQSSGGGVLTAPRQIFLAGADGFDTHADQITAGGAKPTHADKLDELGRSLAAFANALTALGLDDQVTTFTHSDFGRTLKPNARGGTDHGWGGHHLILGGAVRGGLTYGSHPSLRLGGPDDVTANAATAVGRWIPSTSVDQYAATLLRWFEPTLNLGAVLPNLAQFDTTDLGFMNRTR